MKNLIKKILKNIEKYKNNNLDENNLKNILKNVLKFAIIMFFSYCILGMNNSGVFIDKNFNQQTVTYNEFLKMVKDKNVKSVTIKFSDKTFKFVDNKDQILKTDNPKIQDFKEFLLTNDIKVIEKEDSMIFSFIFRLLPLAFLIYYCKGMIPSLDKVKSKTKVPNISFDDIAGNKELKKDLSFVVDFLKNPQKIKDVGARMPKGIILYGPPGTGKTLTAKAIAGTAGVPFFNVCGSDFVEMFVGLGSKRVRDLFNEAKKNAPCIVFIDEIDAVGRKRGIGNNSERDQTINALLSELDGFEDNSGIITICATNKLEDLDNALIRTGRFDKKIYVGLPDKNDRKEIFDVYLKNKKISEDVNLEELSSITIGFSGSDIETLVNESALITATQSKGFIDKNSFETAFFRQVMKGDKKDNQNSRDLEELKIVAWHEAGHTLAIKLLTDEEINKVTILSSTSGAGGVTFRVPMENSLYSKEYIENSIKILYAGRVAEEILFNGNKSKITVGASNDIKQATNYIKNYINSFGMNEEVGLINIDEFNNGNSIVINNNEIMLKEASALSIKLYNETFDLLHKNKELLNKIATSLLNNESLNSSDIKKIMEEN